MRRPLEKKDLERGFEIDKGIVAKSEGEPTWLDNIKIEEFLINPINITYSFLQNKYGIIFQEPATDLEGRVLEGMLAVHVKPAHKVTIGSIFEEASRRDIFKIHEAPIYGDFHRDKKLFEAAKQMLDEDEFKALEALNS